MRSPLPLISRRAPVGVCAINEATGVWANPLLPHILNLQAELSLMHAIFWPNSSGYDGVYFCLAKNKLKLFYVDARTDLMDTVESQGRSKGCGCPFEQNLCIGFSLN